MARASKSNQVPPGAKPAEAIRLYVKPGCTYCEKIIGVLDELNLIYKKIYVEPVDPDSPDQVEKARKHKVEMLSALNLAGKGMGRQLVLPVLVSGDIVLRISDLGAKALDSPTPGPQVSQKIKEVFQ